MKTNTIYFNSGDYLKTNLSSEIDEIHTAIESIKWSPEFSISENGTTLKHQAAYNKVFAQKFSELNWNLQPILRTDPKLIGDFQKGLVFVEVQFGNSSALYRDYYKFQYGLANGLLSLAVLIVPHNAKVFFPTRPKSVQNMAEYTLANTCLNVLPINVPILLIGLLPEN